MAELRTGNWVPPPKIGIAYQIVKFGLREIETNFFFTSFAISPTKVAGFLSLGS